MDVDLISTQKVSPFVNRSWNMVLFGYFCGGLSTTLEKNMGRRQDLLAWKMKVDEYSEFYNKGILGNYGLSSKVKEVCRGYHTIETKG